MFSALRPRAGALAAGAGILAALYFLYFFNLSGVGLLGPDEPRYAAVGRAMFESGDWITPRLWGESWFEKPALLYWMTALGFSAGLGAELAPRIPVALLSVAFLGFYYLALRREFGDRAAAIASMVLATSAAWLAFSNVAVTDLPMAAAFGAAILLAMPWALRGERRGLTSAGAMLGVAVLAKGLVPLVLAAPILWIGRRHWRGLLRPGPALAFLAVAAPWYVLVWLRNGSAFFEEFLLRHHFGRFSSDALGHEQPFWFYAPVLLAGLLPWTPAAALLFRAKLWRDPRVRLLAAVAVFGFVFFSASANKLPGYLLPIIPPACALIGVAVVEARSNAAALALCGLLLALFPIAGAILPQALARGITHVSGVEIPLAGVALAAIAAAAAWFLARRGRTLAAAALIAAGVVCGAVWLKQAIYPVLDRTVSARAFWNRIASRDAEVCVERANRAWRYNLNYYSVRPLPSCEEGPRPARIVQDAEGGPRLANGR